MKDVKEFADKEFTLKLTGQQLVAVYAVLGEATTGGIMSTIEANDMVQFGHGEFAQNEYKTDSSYRAFMQIDKILIKEGLVAE